MQGRDPIGDRIAKIVVGVATFAVALAFGILTVFGKRESSKEKPPTDSKGGSEDPPFPEKRHGTPWPYGSGSM